jgi:two-component system sensor histidine kinase CiaH
VTRGPGERGWHRHAVRTALAATAVVAVALAVLGASVDLLVDHNLVAATDQRIAARLSDLRQDAGDRGATRAVAGDADRDYQGPVFVWAVAAGGSVTAGSGSPALPASLRAVGAVETATIAGTGFRVAGLEGGGAHLVAASSLAPVSRALSTLVIAELLVGPVLLAIAFAGALAIGRRVAAPVEAARRRQLAFTADASHELRTPLSVIRAETSLALEGEPDLAVYAEALERVDAEAERLRRLVEDLLWLARADAEPAAPAAEPVDVGALATEVAGRFGAVATARDQRLLVEVAEREPAVVVAPAVWIDRLIGVLLDNACRHAPPGGTVVLAVGVERDRVRLSVRDSGPGIPEREQERIFGRFHRSTEGGGAAGLGLAIGDAIVRQTSGRWQLGRAPEGGACFSVVWSRSLRGAPG